MIGPHVHMGPIKKKRKKVTANFQHIFVAIVSQLEAFTILVMFFINQSQRKWNLCVLFLDQNMCLFYFDVQHVHTIF